MDYGRRHGDHGRLPVTVNVCLEEFCNIGKLMDFKRVLNVCRGSAIFCQIIVQSIPQLQDRYPKTEWEKLIGCTDIQICLGCNDVDTATCISKKCGMVTIKVENNQMPLMPLFSPVYTSTRPYSQTKSNTQRPLMDPDEIMRMDNRECLVLLRGQKPLRLYKIIPDEHPSFGQLRDVRVSDDVPHGRQEEEKPKAKPTQPPECPGEQPAAPVEQESVPPPPPSSPPPPTQEADSASPPPDAAPPKASGIWGPQYDLSLIHI